MIENLNAPLGLGPRFFRIVPGYGGQVIEFERGEEAKFKGMNFHREGGGLPVHAADVTREITGNLTASYESAAQVKDVAKALKKAGLTEG